MQTEEIYIYIYIQASLNYLFPRNLLLFLSLHFLKKKSTKMGEKLFSIFKLIREAKGYQNFTKPASGPISESENRSGRSHVIPCKRFSTPK